MARNMGTADRIVRAAVVAPLLLIAAWMIGPASVAGVVLAVVAVVMVATAVAGVCPLYSLLHVRTDRRGGAPV